MTNKGIPVEICSYRVFLRKRTCACVHIAEAKVYVPSLKVPIFAIKAEGAGVRVDLDLCEVAGINVIKSVKDV